MTDRHRRLEADDAERERATLVWPPFIPPSRNRTTRAATTRNGSSRMPW